MCYSNGVQINLPSDTNAATWAVVNAFKFTLDTLQLKYNYWDAARVRYYGTRLTQGMDAAVQLISYWTFGTDKTTISTEKSQSGIRDSIWGCEEYQREVPSFGDTHPLGRMKYHRNVRALSESIGAQSWREPQLQESNSGFVKTDVNIEQVAMYLKPEFQLLSESLKASSYDHRNHYMQALDKTLFEPLEKAAEEFKNGGPVMPGMKGDPKFASLVKSGIVSFDQALKEANSQAGCNNMTKGL